MIVIYKRATGEILASFPEIYTLPNDLVVSGWDGDPEDFDQHVLLPEEAYDFENPYSPKNIHDYRIVEREDTKILQRIV